MSIKPAAVEVNAKIIKSGHVKSEEKIDPVDCTDFLEIGGYVAKESVNDVAKGVNLSHEHRRSNLRDTGLPPLLALFN